jgi:proteasome alpha subunit
MTEEPYRWLETIEHRREYINDQLLAGTPVLAFSREEGILLFGVGQGQSKVFEVYDRHAYAAFGHPVDIEKLRQLIIQSAHMEAFTRSGDDVTLRRLVNFSISPNLKNAFDQIFSPPLIVESLLAEVGQDPEHDTLARVHFDGDFTLSEGGISVAARNSDVETNAVKWLHKHLKPSDTLKRTAQLALYAWRVITEHRHFVDAKTAPKQVKLEVPEKTLELALLERHPDGRNHYKPLNPREL